MILALAILILASVSALAAEQSEEEYLSDIRIIYADNFSEASEALLDSGLDGYRIYGENLNANTGKTGIYIAYKTTTNIEDAITDIAVMQMNGGYREGNYQELIKQSMAEYMAMGENYLSAIDYFNKALDAGHYLAEIAHRQLNFYNVVTEGIKEEPSFEGELIGDIFYNGIDQKELATMFMEGNSYALKNIRALLAMGVSYNEDKTTYLEKVAAEAARVSADPNVYNNRDYSELAAIIAPTVLTFGDMFRELELHDKELNYEDDENTDIEYRYAEYKIMADMMRDVEYLNGKQLYDFCLNYEFDSEDYTALYPMVAALNEGQVAMTRVAHFYDVVRYSMTLTDVAEINAELDRMEEEYRECPFNVYTGVDRTLYRDTFALTSEAYRADAFTEEGLSAALYNGKYSGFNVAAKVVGYIGAAYIGFGLAQRGYAAWTAKKAMEAYQYELDQSLQQFATNSYLGNVFYYNGDLPKDAINELFELCVNKQENFVYSEVSSWSVVQKFNHLDKYFNADLMGSNNQYLDSFVQIKNEFAQFASKDQFVKSAQDAAEQATQKVSESVTVLRGCFIIGGIMMLISAAKLGYSAWHYYHPKYDDIPTALVDLIETPDGDRYIKYDVVYDIEPGERGELVAADLNAFEASRWNALYYTKSYEAGKPLLADEFKISNRSNVPDKNYMPVHRFGELVCYDLNKYNFDDDHSIYLSVKQSQNQKAAVADVPELIGSVFSTGWLIFVGGIGAALGVGSSLGIQKLAKTGRSKKDEAENAT